MSDISDEQQANIASGSSLSTFISSNNMANRMDIEQNISSDQNVHNGQSEHGAISNGNGSAGVIRIPRSIIVKPVSISFKKKIIWYSYGYAFKQLSSTAPEGINYTTLLSYIPVDTDCSYLTPSEFYNLPIGSKVTHVSCDIQILGVRTSFDVGTTLTGTANSEHVLIGLCAINLNSLNNFTNATYKTDATKPMITNRN